MAGPNKKAYLKSRKNDPAMGLSVFNHVSCPVTVTTLPALVVLHSSVSMYSVQRLKVSHARVRMPPHQYTFQIRGKFVASLSLWSGRKREFLLE